MTPNPEHDRAAFEAWWKDKFSRQEHYLMRDRAGNYTNQRVFDQFLGWQAARSLPVVVTDEMVERCAESIVNQIVDDWSDQDERSRSHYRRTAKAVLSAALNTTTHTAEGRE